MISNTQEMRLSQLRERVRGYMSEKRFSHTLAVERETANLAEIYAADEEFSLRAAALLHDITKELSFEKQLQLCKESAIIYTQEETFTPKIFHSRTAAAVIARDFREYATPEILSAIRWHTTGHADMTVGEQILFLADYIEDTRTFESCVELRRFFYAGLDAANDAPAYCRLLCDTMIYALDLTVGELVSEKKPIHPDTIAARNYFIYQKVRCFG